MGDQTRGHERLQRAVDGRAVYARLQPVHRVRDVVGGQMRVGSRQCLEDRDSRVGDPGALRAEFADGGRQPLGAVALGALSQGLGRGPCRSHVGSTPSSAR